MNKHHNLKMLIEYEVFYIISNYDIFDVPEILDLDVYDLDLLIDKTLKKVNNKKHLRKTNIDDVIIKNVKNWRR